MKRIHILKRPRNVRAYLAGLCLALAGGQVTVLSAQSSGGPYELTKHTIDGGGGLSTGGEYALHGTIGQADAEYLDAPGYELQGGFWGGCPPQADDGIFTSDFDGC